MVSLFDPLFLLSVVPLLLVFAQIARWIVLDRRTDRAIDASRFGTPTRVEPLPCYFCDPEYAEAYWLALIEIDKMVNPGSSYCREGLSPLPTACYPAAAVCRTHERHVSEAWRRWKNIEEVAYGR